MFEILSEKNFNLKFGEFKKCENLWEDIDESVVDLLLFARFKEEAKDIKEMMLEGRSIPCMVGYIRKKTDAEKCCLCGSSFYGAFHSISIVDNETKICPDCGMREQLERFTGSYDR